MTTPSYEGEPMKDSVKLQVGSCGNPYCNRVWCDCGDCLYCVYNGGPDCPCTECHGAA